MDGLLRDLRVALRTLFGRQWLYSAIVVLVLGLGIGATVAIFNMINAMLIRPLPYHDAERLVAIHEAQPRLGTFQSPVSPANFQEWRRQARAFEGMAAYTRRSFDASREGEPERVAGGRTSANLFPLLGVRPALGRPFAPEDEAGAGRDVALLSHRLWERRFGRDPGVVGKTLVLDGRPHQVVGVMPPGFGFPEWAEVWTPLGLDAPGVDRRGARSLSVVARLRPGATLEQAAGEMRTLSRSIHEPFPELEGWEARVLPLRKELMPLGPRMGLYMMLAAVVLLLLIVTGNVAAMVLASAVGRRQEMTVRMALGAGRGRLVRQLLTENVLLALMGGVVGIVVSLGIVHLMVSSVPIQIPFWIDFSLDARVVAFAVLVSLWVGGLFGTAPAWRATDVTSFELLRDGGKSGGGVRKVRLLNGLVVMEFALSVVLLVSAVLMATSFRRLQNSDPGFDADNLLSLRLSLNSARYGEPAPRAALLRDALQRVRALPGVESAGAVDFLPVSPDGYARAVVTAEGRPVRPGEEPAATHYGASAGYLAAVRIPILRGRDLTPREAEEGAPVALVSASLAEAIWPGADPLGRRIRTARMRPGEWLTVVGVVRSMSADQPMIGGDALPKHQMYVPVARSLSQNISLVVRTRGDPAALASPVRAAVWDADPTVPLYQLYTMREVISRVLWLPRLWGQVFSAFGMMALLIAAVGVYGVTSYAVGQRSRELAIRAAVGSPPRQILALVLRGHMRLVAGGLVLGIVLALGSTRAMAGLLYDVSYADPFVYLSVTLLLTVVAVLATLAPARRASRISPATALRGD
jgi:putative ABC transport system permease protein